MADNLDVAIDHFSSEFNPNVSEDGKLPSEEAAPEEPEAVEAAPEEPEATEEEPEVAEEAVEEEIKYFTVQDGDEEVQLAENLEIPVKVGKKEKMVSLAKLRDTYAGSTGIKRQSELLKIERDSIEAAKGEHQKSLSALNSKLVKFANAVDRGDTEMVLNEMLQATGRDANEFWDKYHKQQAEFYGQYNNLSADQKQAVIEDRNQKAQLQKYRDMEQEHKTLQASTQFTEYANDLLTRSGLQQAEVEEVWTYLDQQAQQGSLNPEDVKALKEAPQEKRLEYAVNYALGFKNYNRVAGVVKDAGGIADKDLPSVITDLYSTLGDQIYNLPDKDLAEIIKGVYLDKQKTSRGSGALKSKASPRLRKTDKVTSVAAGKNPWAMTAQDFMS